MSTFENSGKRPHDAKSRSSYDSATPTNLVSFMLSDWDQRPKKLPPPHKALAFFQARRDALSKRFPEETILVPTGHMKVRSNDTFYPFRPASDFFYLTGLAEPDCVLALVPEVQGHRAVLFVEPNPGRKDPSFFTDRLKGELWEGPRPTLDDVRARYGIEDVRGLPEFSTFLSGASVMGVRSVRCLHGHSELLERSLTSFPTRTNQKDQELAVFLSEQRLLKDSWEVLQLKAAIDSTKNGFEDVIRRLKTAKSEREIEGIFFLRARMEGNDVGYGTIAAAGAHACTLHWKRNDGAIKKGDLLLLDAGVEGHSFYTADVTRTLPISGKFSKEQREIYQLVWEAQAAALKAVKPGNEFLEPNRVAMEVLAVGLERLGILPTTAEEALKHENQFYKRYSLHNVSHMLGLDVHDCAQARLENYRYGTLEAGMVLTVEPGLYFQPDDLTVPKKYRGIGVRIEDDVVVTAKGMKNLSANLPSEAKAVEAWMSKIWKKK